MAYTVQKIIEEKIEVETGALIWGDINEDEFFFTGLKITYKSALQTKTSLIDNKIYYLSANIRYTYEKGNIIINSAGGKHLAGRLFIQGNDMNIDVQTFNDYVIEVNGVSSSDSIQFGSGAPTGSTDTIPNLYTDEDTGDMYAWTGSVWLPVGGSNTGVTIYGEFPDDDAAGSGGVPLGALYVRDIHSGFYGLLAKRLN